jgi:hypothetical protein
VRKAAMPSALFKIVSIDALYFVSCVH